jgi:hypothetical protein
MKFNLPRLEPPDDFVLLNPLFGANARFAAASLGDTSTRLAHTDVKVHAVNTNRRVVLDAQVDVFTDTEAKVAGLGEVAFSQLIFLNLQSALQNLLSFRAADGDMHSDLFVTSNSECADSISSLACGFLLENRTLRPSIDTENTL